MFYEPLWDCQCEVERERESVKKRIFPARPKLIKCTHILSWPLVLGLQLVSFVCYYFKHYIQDASTRTGKHKTAPMISCRMLCYMGEACRHVSCSTPLSDVHITPEGGVGIYMYCHIMSPWAVHINIHVHLSDIHVCTDEVLALVWLKYTSTQIKGIYIISNP